MVRAGSARTLNPRREPEAISPLWLAHHYPEDYDRCVVVAGRHVCRRCLALYPVALAVLVVVLAARWEDAPAVAWALVLLPLPAVADFVLEHLGRSRPSPRRLVAVSVPLGVGLGAGLARYAAHPTDPLFWAVAVGYSLVCLAALLSGRRATGRGGGDVERAA